MNKLRTAIFLLSCFVISSTAQASEIKGTSLGEYASCDYYLIEDSVGDYTLVEWYGGATTYAGDVVYGELHSYGFKDLYDATSDRSTRVWIDDYLLSEDSAAEKLIDKCGYKGSIESYLRGGSGGYYSSYIPPVASSCVLNASYINGKCACNVGYQQSGSTCVTYTQACQVKYGVNSYGDDAHCFCQDGYQFNEGQTACVTKPVIACGAGFILKNNQCISHNEDCRLSFGLNVVGSAGPVNNSNCDCAAGYSWNEGGTACLSQQIVTPSSVINSPPIKSQVGDFKVKEIDKESMRGIGEVITAATFRKCPSKECSVIRYYAEGAQLPVLSQYKKDEWYEVRGSTNTGEKEGNIEGWIYKPLLKMMSSEQKNQVAQEQKLIINQPPKKGIFSRILSNFIDWLKL